MILPQGIAVGTGMFERRSEPMISRSAFFRRMLLYVGLALLIDAGSLGVGMIGYHFLEGLPWVDAFLNASMILGGMGPVNVLHTTAGKLFASFYAMYSGLIFLVVAGVLLAPVVHRFMHHFHLDTNNA